MTIISIICCRQLKCVRLPLYRRMGYVTTRTGTKAARCMLAPPCNRSHPHLDACACVVAQAIINHVRKEEKVLKMSGKELINIFHVVHMLKRGLDKLPLENVSRIFLCCGLWHIQHAEKVIDKQRSLAYRQYNQTIRSAIVQGKLGPNL